MFPWTPDHCARLLALRKQGLSGAQIASVMGGGLSRSAVISKLNGLGAARHTKKQFFKRKPLPKTPPIPIDPKLKPRALETLSENECRYPFGNQSPYLFCGQSSHGSWCEQHRAVVWNKGAGQ